MEVRRRQGAGGPREVRHVLDALLPGAQRPDRPSRRRSPSTRCWSVGSAGCAPPVSAPGLRAGWASRSDVRRLLPPSDERGVAPSSPLALLSAAAVVSPVPRSWSPTGSGPTTRRGSSPTTASAAPAPTKTAHQQVIKKHVAQEAGGPPRRDLRRGVQQLRHQRPRRQHRRARPGRRLAGGGVRQLVRHDPATTDLLPARGCEPPAELLGKDLGIARLKPTIPPMRGDRLTVILTADYA